MKLDPEVAARYGMALFSIARKRDAANTLMNESQVLTGLIPRGSKIRTFLEGPQFNTSDQMAVTRRVFEGKFNEILVNLLLLLIRRRRIYYLEAILKTFERLVEESRGIFPAEVISAVDMDVTQRASLELCLERYTKNNLKINYRVDPKIVGGVVFKFRDLLVDDSVRTRLDGLRQTMVAARVR